MNEAQNLNLQFPKPRPPDEQPNLNHLRDACFEMSKSKGFHEELRPFPEVLCLIHSEVSEALEDHRLGREPTAHWYQAAGGVGSALYCPPPSFGQPLAGDKPCGIPSEMADIIIRVLDACGEYGIDIDRAVREKMAYNATRPHKHGKAY